MSISATVANAQAAAANDALEEMGFGPNNFSVPVRKTPNAQGTHLGMHNLGDNPALEAAVSALPNVQFRIAGRMVNEFAAHMAAQGMVLVKAYP